MDYGKNSLNCFNNLRLLEVAEGLALAHLGTLSGFRNRRRKSARDWEGYAFLSLQLRKPA
jgi:hypothetical protein